MYDYKHGCQSVTRDGKTEIINNILFYFILFYLIEIYLKFYAIIRTYYHRNTALNCSSKRSSTFSIVFQIPWRFKTKSKTIRLTKNSNTVFRQTLLLPFNDDPDLFKKVITDNESWVCGYYIETKAKSSHCKSSSVKCEGFAHCFLRFQWRGAS